MVATIDLICFISLRIPHCWSSDLSVALQCSILCLKEAHVLPNLRVRPHPLNTPHGYKYVLTHSNNCSLRWEPGETLYPRSYRFVCSVREVLFVYSSCVFRARENQHGAHPLSILCSVVEMAATCQAIPECLQGSFIFLYMERLMWFTWTRCPVELFKINSA